MRNRWDNAPVFTGSSRCKESFCPDGTAEGWKKKKPNSYNRRLLLTLICCFLVDWGFFLFSCLGLRSGLAELLQGTSFVSLRKAFAIRPAPRLARVFTKRSRAPRILH